MMVLSMARGVVIWIAIINFSCVFQAKSEMRVGPWGGRGGDIWAYEPKGIISKITVTYDSVIHSICFTSIDENGNLDESEFPCKKAAKTAEINIDYKTEKLNGISGTFRAINKCSKTITSLSFTTNTNKTYGPFGTVRGTAFSLVVEDDDGFSGFHGSTGWLLDNIGVSLVTPTSSDVGPWGGDGGDDPYEYMATGTISRILITIEGGATVHSITFTSKDKNGSLSSPTKIGGPGAPDTVDSQIDLDVDQGEKLVGISGTYGIYHGFEVVTSLKFYTNKGRSFGPFGGEEGGTSFSYMGGNNKCIAGFYGREGGLLDSIGLHVKAEEFVTFGELGTTSNAANAWTYQPDGAISHISITYADAIYSIKFASVDGNGTITGSKKFGTDISRGKAEIDIDTNKKEKLRGISGTVGYKKGWKVITSLTFLTSKNRTFGPYGTETGTAFSVPLKEGFISGFHGSSGKWLEAIGVYATPT